MADENWFEIDFGRKQPVSAVKVHLVVDRKRYDLPDKLEVVYLEEGEWIPVRVTECIPADLTGNTVNMIRFDPVNTSAIRINITHPGKQVFFSEIECI